jgi:indole-3-glycerol phosphate synthase
MQPEDSPKGFLLERILRHKREEVAARKGKVPLEELKGQSRDLPAPRDFLQAISRRSEEWGALPVPPIRLIAEIKKASPSRGLLREDFDPQELAQGYARGGASALSVLTDSSFFRGSFEYLRGAKGWVKLPLLQKDFILEEYQIWEGRAWGADAVLLIAALLDQEILKALCHMALKIGVEPLIEVHDLSDVRKALEADSRIIGINNRDLRTFQVDLNTTFHLVGEIGPHKSIVSESGICTREEVIRLEAMGLDAVLVGEALMKSHDPGKKARELLGRA